MRYATSHIADPYDPFSSSSESSGNTTTGCITRFECEQKRYLKQLPAVTDCSKFPVSCPGVKTSSKCAQRGGACIDTNRQRCPGTLVRGLCPGGSNILCCTPGTGATGKTSPTSRSGGTVTQSAPIDADSTTTPTVWKTAAPWILGVGLGVVLITVNSNKKRSK